MNAWMVLLAIVALAVLFVLLPVGVATFSHYRRPRRLRCPVAGTEASVSVDATGAALSEVLGGRARLVRACSLWPWARGCRQQCLADGEPLAGVGSVAQDEAAARRRILVPLDGTPESESALSRLGELAGGDGARVRLLQVVPVATAVRAADDRIIAFADQETDRIEKEVLAHLRVVAARVPDVEIERVVRFGEPAEEIAEEAESSGADLIAMATHERAGVSALLTGSTAEKVARITRVPVIRIPCRVPANAAPEIRRL